MSLLLKDLRFIVAVVVVAAAGIAMGCGKQSGKSALVRLGVPREQIVSYKVTKPELVDPTLVARSTPALQTAAATTEQQTLGVIVPVGNMGWFFKLTGDLAAVEPQHEAFLQFVTSIKFSPGPNSKPTWKLPMGWKEQPGREMRFATIQIAAEGKPLELTVIPLPKPGGDEQKYILDNVNRWRGQLNLKPIAASELAETTKPLKIDGHEATLVSLVGTGGGGMTGAPFASGAANLPADHPPLTGAPAASAANSAGSRGAPKDARGELKFEVPQGWSEAAANAFSMVAFRVAEGGKQVDITVSAAGGDLLSNVNRWRGQVGLQPVDETELGKFGHKIETFGTSGDYVELVGPASAEKRRTILGVRADAGGATWFVKLIGDSELAEREKSHFEAFVKSLRLP